VIEERSAERSKVAAGVKTDGWKENCKRHWQELLIARLRAH